MDWAFVPYWILENANKQGIKIDAKMIGIYHLYPQQMQNYGELENINPLTKQGETIRIAYRVENIL